MTTVRKKIVERLNGIGKVFQEENLIAKVRFDLVVSQEVLIAHTFGGTSQTDGRTSAEGSLNIIEGEAFLMSTREPLILELDDSRRMKFFAVNHEPLANRYRIVRTGGWLDGGMTI